MSTVLRIQLLASLILGAPSALASEPTPQPAPTELPAPASEPEDDDARETAAPEPTIADEAFTAAMKKPPEEVAKRCGAAVAGMEEVLTPGGVLVLGELHGTREVPALVRTVSCHVASAGVPVVVGLEVPREEQRALRCYLKSNGGKEARASLTEGTFWRRPHQDGRSSEAIAALMESLRVLRSQGLNVSVFAYDAPGQGSQRSALMAKRVLEVHETAPKSSFVLLGGNVNASTVRGTEWDETFTPMGWHLVRAKLPVRSLDIRYSKGTAWNCSLGEEQKLSCGAVPAVPPAARRNDKVVYRGPRAFMELTPESKHEGFDGVFYVGPLTASPPAVSFTAKSH
ncbi:hypothetical protein [Archangium lansingense]|uniref:Haem-binding uptake Tiki superfamily ChaN domain-containing protein n=1 Tax=Archangium lansingense TaxID=2995310 RepID=A0ABT3ZV43_9BACT|nr:hypothetical protein [Archangium lansinium]MCY1073274.1 hypothetical protein [Archangium lansinium]